MKPMGAPEARVAEFARPDLIASPEWLAENIGRPDVRVLDLRWRPDGTAPELYAAGHVPGAIRLDWQTSVVESAEGSDALVLASPDRMAETMAAAGIADGTTAVLYDDTLSYHAARAWWSLYAYGFETARILDGGYPAWVAIGGGVRSGEDTPSPARFTPRLQARRRLTTGDVRGMMGSPESVLIDARGPAEYHGYEGNARRLGHIPGAVNVPVGATHQPGTQRLRDPAGAPQPAAQGQHHPRPAADLLRPVGARGVQARLGPHAPRPRRRRGVRGRLGRVGRPDGPARQPVATAGRVSPRAAPARPRRRVRPGPPTGRPRGAARGSGSACG